MRAEEILAGYRTELAAKGFRFGVLIGEMSVRPGAHGYQDAQAVGRGGLTGIPLAVAAGPWWRTRCCGPGRCPSGVP